MATLENDHEKIQKICNVLKSQALEPAQAEAERIIADAQLRASEMLKQADLNTQTLLANAKKQMENERSVFDAALSQAKAQCMEALRQSIETALFNPALDEILSAEMQNPHVISNLISAAIKALEKEGMALDLNVFIPKTIDPETINSLLLAHILKKLKYQTVQVGEIAGGIQIRLIDKKMTLEMTKESLEDFFKIYIRKDFRKKLFRDTDNL